MSKLAKVALLSVVLTTLPAVAADPAREPVGSGSPQYQNEDARQRECQKYQGAQRDECLQGKHFGGQVEQHPSLPGGDASGRQEVPGLDAKQRSKLVGKGAKARHGYVSEGSPHDDE